MCASVRTELAQDWVIFRYVDGYRKDVDAIAADVGASPPRDAQ